MSQSPCPTCGLLYEHPLPSEIPPSPYFSELLSVNTPPSHTEVAGLRQIVEESSAYIDSLQSQIRKAQETLSTLTGLQEMASRKRAAAKRVLHPMRSLPQDILIEIFLCCTPIVNHHELEWWYDEFDSLRPPNHPWNISHVSHRWREIALSLPRLWSVIYLGFGTPYSRRQCTFMGTLLLERSAKLDLCVNIASGDEYIGDHPLTPLLKETTTRWRILNADMTSPSLQSFSGCEFPLLEEIGVRDPDQPIESEVPVDTFRNVQNVRTVNLYRSFTNLGAWDAIGQFSWNKLSKLTCHCDLLQADFLSILAQSSGVEDLTVKFHDSWVSSPLQDRDFPPHSITLPALRRLEVTEDEFGNNQIEEFAKHLQLPSIRDLTLTFGTDYHLCHWFTTLVLHPDFHRVSSLCITCSMARTSGNSDYIGGSKTLLQLLRIMLGVEGFQLKDENVTSEFLDGLVVGAGKGAVVLPSLKTLNLRECGFVDHDVALDSILRIVESRSLSPLCPPLERIVLPQEDWLNGFIVDGVEVV